MGAAASRSPAVSQRSSLRPSLEPEGNGYSYGAATTSLGASQTDAEAPADEFSAAASLVGGEVVETGRNFSFVGKQTAGEDSEGGSDGSSDGSSARSTDGLTKQILALALPALVSLCVDPLMSAVDTAYIGRLGSDSGGGEVGLGALGLNTYVFAFSFYVFGFFATVPTPFVASARARGDEIGAANLVGRLLTFALMVGLVLMLVLEAFGQNILHFMGSTPVNAEEALLFLRARALSAPAVLLITVANGAFRGYLDTRTPLFIAVGANALNFVLDPILIFKLDMGVQGAAIATVSAEWAAAVTFLILLERKTPSIKLRGVTLPSSREGWEDAKAVATSSAAVFGRTVALQVASQLWMLLAYAADSLAVAAQGLIADRVGAGIVPAAREVAGRVLAALVPVMSVIGFLQPINAYVYVGDGVLQGSQDFVYEALTMAFSASAGAGYIFSRRYLGTDITLLDVWVGITIMQGSRAATFSVRHWLDPRGPLAVGKGLVGTGEDDSNGDLDDGYGSPDSGNGIPRS
eukprot:jgi/Undpi1/220/HiC_scaffold_1.g00217.m1